MRKDNKTLMVISTNIKKLLGSKIVKNGIWLYVLQMFNTVIPLITLPYITRVLGAQEYGVFSIAFNLSGYLMVVVEYGFGMSGSRKASLAKNLDELHVTFTAIVVSRAFLCLICGVGTLFYGYLVIESEKQRLCLFLLYLIPLGIVLQQNWVFQGLQKMQYITLSSIIARLLSLVCIFCFVKTPDDLALYCVFYASTTIIIGIIGTYYVLSRIGLRFVKIGINNVLDELKSGWYVFTTSLSSKVFNTFGITVLGLLSTEYYVGVFSAIQKIPQMVLLIWSPIAQVLFPVTSQEMTASFKNGRKFVLRVEKWILPIFIILIVIIGSFARNIVAIAFGREFADYHYLIYPLLFWLIIGIINNFNGVQTLLAGGFYKEYSRCFLIGVMITVISNLALVHIFGVIGAAIAPAISEFVFGMLLFGVITKIGKRG